MKKATALEGDLVDYLVWKNYGKQPGYVEAVLDHLGNLEVNFLPEQLPFGTVVEMPDVIVSLPTKRLWD